MPFSDGNIGFFSRYATFAYARFNLNCRYSALPFRTPSGLCENDGATFGRNLSGMAKLKLRFDIVSALKPDGVIPTFRNDPVLSTREDQFGHVEHTMARKSPCVIVLHCQFRPCLSTTPQISTNMYGYLCRGTGGVIGNLLRLHVSDLSLAMRGMKLFANLVHCL